MTASWPLLSKDESPNVGSCATVWYFLNISTTLSLSTFSASHAVSSHVILFRTYADVWSHAYPSNSPWLASACSAPSVALEAGSIPSNQRNSWLDWAFAIAW